MKKFLLTLLALMCMFSSANAVLKSVELTPSDFGSGSAYVTAEREISKDGFTFGSKEFNPSSGQIRCNKTGNGAFYIYNKKEMNVKQIEITFSVADATKSPNKGDMYVATDGPISSCPSSGNFIGSWNSTTLTATWDFSTHEGSFFRLNMNTNTGGTNKFSKIVILYDDGVTVATTCDAPTMKVEGNEVTFENGVATLDAYHASTITISGAYGTTVEWFVKANDGESTLIDGDSYMIPETANAGEVFTFTAQANITGADNKPVYSDIITLTVNIIASPTSYTFDFVNNTYGLGVRMDDNMNSCSDKTIMHPITGITLKTSSGKMRLFTDGLRLDKGSYITFVAPAGYIFSTADVTRAFTTTISDDKKECTVLYDGSQTRYALPEVALAWEEEKGTVGVAGVEASEGEARWFDVQGRQVSADAKGLLIMVKGGKAIKVIK